MKRIIIYFGDPERCPPCRAFQGDWQKIEPVFKEHGIVFVNGSGDLRSLPISDDFFKKSRNMMDKIQRIPQFHFFEVGASGEIEKYKSEVGYVGVIGFVRMMSKIFQLTNKESNMTDGSVMDPTKGSPGNPTANRRMTLGEMRVRVSFNPSSGQSGEYIDRIKKQSAELIDLIDGVASPKFNDDEFKEWVRLKELAITAIEEGAMWAVKSATV